MIDDQPAIRADWPNPISSLEVFMRTLSAAFVSALLVTSPAFATETLVPGKPAGVKDAQEVTANSAVLAAGMGTVLAGLIMVATDDDKGPAATTAPPTSTSTTGTP